MKGAKYIVPQKMNDDQAIDEMFREMDLFVDLLKQVRDKKREVEKCEKDKDALTLRLMHAQQELASLQNKVRQWIDEQTETEDPQSCDHR